MASVYLKKTPSCTVLLEYQRTLFWTVFSRNHASRFQEISMRNTFKLASLVAFVALSACIQPPAVPRTSDPTVLLEGTPLPNVVQPTFAQEGLRDQAVTKFKALLAAQPSLPQEPDPKGGGKVPAGFQDGKLVGKDLMVAVTNPSANPFFEREPVLTTVTQPAPPEIPFLEDDLIDDAPAQVQPQSATLALRKITPIGKLSQRVKLFMHFSKPSTSAVCSGTLVDSQWIMTAGHCVYRFDGENAPSNGYTTLVEVAPGFSGSSEPFGRAFGSQILVFSGWRDHGDFDHDIAFVRVERPIGGVVGFNFVLPLTCSPFLTGPDAQVYQTSGYPGEKAFGFNGLQMYHMSFRFDKCDGFQATVNEATFGGMSGSGALLSDGPGPGAVFAVLSTSDRKTVSTYARMTSGKLNTVGDEFSNSAPSSPDLVALMARAQDASIKPPKIRVPSLRAASGLKPQRSRTGGLTCIKQGGQVRAMFTVHNFSNVQFEGTLRYTIYLSDDDRISTSDKALGSFTLNDVFADYRQSRFVSNIVNLPSFTPTGRKFIGVIITNSDFDTLNNDSSDDDAGELEIRSSCP
jgi:V8-like Glu-specific endopeptidase